MGWGLSVGRALARASGGGGFPGVTVSRSEGGFGAVSQGSAVVPNWVVTGDEERRWEVRLRWSVGTAKGNGESPSLSRGEVVGVVAG